MSEAALGPLMNRSSRVNIRTRLMLQTSLVIPNLTGLNVHHFDGRQAGKVDTKLRRFSGLKVEGHLPGSNDFRINLHVIRPMADRSEERRVGKECRSRWAQ